MMKRAMISLMALVLVLGPSCAPGGDETGEPGEESPGEEGGVPALAGSAWQWQQTLMGNDDRFEPERPGDYTVRFMADGTLDIRADCNRVRGTYTLEEHGLSIELGPSTMAACPEGSLGDRFTANLVAANSYFFQGEDLLIDLLYDSGTMRFAPWAPSLFESAWIVTDYDHGQGGVASTLGDTDLTAEFGLDGTITGFAGCNTYRGTFEAEGQSISFGPFITTRMYCDQPDGIIAQEEGYLAALGTSATFEFNGDRLEMRTEEGSLVARFQAAGRQGAR